MTPADEVQITRVVAAVTSVLGDMLVGVYLHGSAVLGGLRPTSDLDFLVVVDDHVEAAPRSGLVQQLVGVSGRSAPHPGRPVEVSVVAIDQLASWSHPPVAEFQYGEWLRSEYESGHVPLRAIAADLTILLDTARRHGVALVGPVPSTVLPDIPESDLVAASISGIDGLLADLEGDERNVLLTFARMLVTAETGEVIPKDVAAEAVADRVADARLLEAAAADYRGEPWLGWSEHTEEVRACVQQLIQSVQAAGD